MLGSPLHKPTGATMSITARDNVSFNQSGDDVEIFDSFPPSGTTSIPVSLSILTYYDDSRYVSDVSNIVALFRVHVPAQRNLVLNAEPADIKTYYQNGYIVEIGAMLRNWPDTDTMLEFGNTVFTTGDSNLISDPLNINRVLLNATTAAFHSVALTGGRSLVYWDTKTIQEYHYSSLGAKLDVYVLGILYPF